MIISIAFAFLIVYWGDGYYHFNLETIQNYFFGICLIIFCILWIYCFISDILSKKKLSDFLNRFVNSIIIHKLSVLFQVLFIFIIIAVVVISLKANRIYEYKPGKEKIYLLYDDSYHLPKIILASIFYPMIIGTVEKFGEGSFKMAVITPESFNEAFHKAKLLFIASHGDEEGIKILNDTNLVFRPNDIPSISDRPNLQFVYLTGCNLSTKTNDWIKALSGTKMVVFNRYSAMLEHLLWIWKDADKEIKDLK